VETAVQGCHAASKISRTAAHEAASFLLMLLLLLLLPTMRMPKLAVWLILPGQKGTIS
jgi:hypothetical protein